MSFFLSNDSPVLDCHFHLKISHFMAPHFMCISGITQDRNYVCYFRSRPPSRSPPFDTEQPDLVIFRLLVPLKRLTPGSLPASTFGLMLFVEHRQAFVRRMSLIRQPMALIFSGFRKKTYASLASPGCFSSLRNVPVLFRTETRVVCHSTLFPLRAQSPRRNAVKSSLHSFRVPPVMLSIFPCS